MVVETLLSRWEVRWVLLASGEHRPGIQPPHQGIIWTKRQQELHSTACKASVYLSHTCSGLLCSIHSVFFLLLEHTKLDPATGPLYLVSHQPEALSPRFSGCWHPHHSSLRSTVTSSTRLTLTNLSAPSPYPHPHPYPRNFPIHLLCSSQHQFLKLAFFPLYVHFLLLTRCYLHESRDPVSLDLEHFAWYMVTVQEVDKRSCLVIFKYFTWP